MSGEAAEPVIGLVSEAWGEVVAIIKPLLSKAKNLPAVGPVRKACPVVVALVKMVEEAFRLTAVRVLIKEVEAFK